MLKMFDSLEIVRYEIVRAKAGFDNRMESSDRLYLRLNGIGERISMDDVVPVFAGAQRILGREVTGAAFPLQCRVWPQDFPDWRR